MRTVGAVVRGIRTPIVREGDDLVTLVRDSVMAASETEHITFHDRDIVAVTESVVARAAGNYATVQNIADDVKAKFGCDHIGVIFPILSRNRFAICLRGIANGAKKIVLMLLSFRRGRQPPHLAGYARRERHRPVPRCADA